MKHVMSPVTQAAVITVWQVYGILYLNLSEHKLYGLDFHMAGGDFNLIIYAIELEQEILWQSKNKL